MKTNYSDTATQSLAYNLFEQKQTSFNDEQLSYLKEALDNLLEYTPSDYQQGIWSNQYGHVENIPQQIVRDQLIVDYLVQQKNMTLDQAVDISCAWEDEEFELLN